MARRALTKKDIDEQIKQLREKRKALELKELERIGKIAAEAGLSDLDIPDETLKKAFVELAARFRKEPAKPVQD